MSIQNTFSADKPKNTNDNLYPYRWISLVIVCAAAFLTVLDFFIVNVAIPAVQNNLHASYAKIQLIIAGYGLTYSVGLITGGRLGDIFGRKKMFMFGVVGFTIASTLCGLSTTPNMLIVSRIFQGVMSALMMPQVLSILQVTFPPHEKNLAFSIYGITLGMACIAGQVLGGLLIDLNLFGLSWRPIFLVNIPVGIIAIIASTYFVKESFSLTARKLDLIGVLIVSLGLSLLIYPLIQGRESGWPTYMLFLLISSVPVLVIFTYFEKWKFAKDGSPLVDFSLFKERSFLVGLIVILCFQNTLASFFFLYTVNLQIGLGFSSLRSGLTFGSFGIGFLLASTFSVKILPKLGKYIVHTGLFLMIVGLLWFIQLTYSLKAEITSMDMLAPLFIYGVGQGLVLTPLMNIILSNTNPNHAGTASGILITAQQFALALGLAIIGVIFFGNLASNSDKISTLYSENFEQEMLKNGVDKSYANKIKLKLAECINQQNIAKDPNALPELCMELIHTPSPSQEVIKTGVTQNSEFKGDFSKKISAIIASAKTQSYYEAFAKSLIYNILVLLFSFFLAFLLPGKKVNKEEPIVVLE